MGIYYDKWWQRSDLKIAQGSLTNSKHRNRFIEGIYPTHVTHGQGCFLYDYQGKKYVDYICGLGTNLLGYGHRGIADAVIKELWGGVTHSLPTIMEVEFAEYFTNVFGYCERIKVFKTASEGISAALKIALTYTGKDHYVVDGYHGWHAPVTAHLKDHTGCPSDYKKYVHRATDNFDWDSLGAYIVEPVITEWSDERRNHLWDISQKCDQHGVPLIFDETITAFRFPKLSVAHEIGVAPDLTVLGKALGGGFPISVVGGREALMNDIRYFASGTFCGEIAAMAASLVVMQEAHRVLVTELWNNGEIFLEKINKACRGVVKFDGYPTRGIITGTDENKALFMQECCRVGILFGPSWFINTHHRFETDNVTGLCGEICKRISQGEVRLLGKMPIAPMANQVRQKSGDNLGAIDAKART